MRKSKLNINQLWKKFHSWTDDYIAKCDVAIDKFAADRWTGETQFMTTLELGDPEESRNGYFFPDFEPERHKTAIRDKARFLKVYFRDISFDGIDFFNSKMRLLPLQLPLRKRGSIGVWLKQDEGRSNLSPSVSTEFLEWEVSLFVNKISDICFGSAHGVLPFDYIYIQNFSDRAWTKDDAREMALAIKYDLESDDYCDFVMKAKFTAPNRLSLVLIWDPTDLPLAEQENPLPKNSIVKSPRNKLPQKAAAKKAPTKAATKAAPMQHIARVRGARRDASIGSIAKRIQKAFKLPDGSVKLMLPNGKKAHMDGRIKNLLEKWDNA